MEMHFRVWEMNCIKWKSFRILLFFVSSFILIISPTGSSKPKREESLIDGNFHAKNNYKVGVGVCCVVMGGKVGSIIITFRESAKVCKI
jgi:hypothetical protein